MMEREEIVKALRCCGSRPDRRDCEEKRPYFCGIDMSRCIPNMISDAIALLEADTANIAMLKAENERIRQNSVSQEAYQMMCEERDAAVKDINRIGAEKCLDYRQQTYTSPCKYCKYYAECDFIPTDDGCCFEWRGL